MKYGYGNWKLRNVYVFVTKGARWPRAASAWGWHVRHLVWSHVLGQTITLGLGSRRGKNDPRFSSKVLLLGFTPEVAKDYEQDTGANEWTWPSFSLSQRDAPRFAEWSIFQVRGAQNHRFDAFYTLSHDQRLAQDQHLNEMSLGSSSPVFQCLLPCIVGEQASCIMRKKQKPLLPAEARDSFHILHITLGINSSIWYYTKWLMWLVWPKDLQSRDLSISGW